jgi:hypothetical protein
MINFLPERRSFVEEQFSDFYEFIRFNIDHNRYIEMLLDEFYIPERNAYKNFHFAHTNIIYGYDDAFIYILGVGYANKPSAVKVEISVMNEAYESCRQSIDVIYIMYYMHDEMYDFHIGSFMHILTQYLNGEVINPALYNIQLEENMAIGINIYDMLTTQKGVELLKNDQRISYVLMEHKKCMVERIKFLYTRGYLNKSEYDKILEMTSNVYRTSRTFMNILLKNVIKSDDAIESKILPILAEMKEAEKEAYTYLLMSLEKKS